MTFDISEIQSAWKMFSSDQMKEVLVKGEKVYLDLSDPMPMGATSATIVPTKKAMSFPDYLEKRWKK